MAEIIWTVEGRRFRNAEEYQAALRDKELIDSITGSLKLDNPKDVEILYYKRYDWNYNIDNNIIKKYDDKNKELEKINKKQEQQKK